MLGPSRRELLQRLACGFGGVSWLASLLADEARGDSGTMDPLAPKSPLFPAKAKRVIFLFMHGGVSHVDTFDPKPKLAAMNGSRSPSPSRSSSSCANRQLARFTLEIRQAWGVRRRVQRIVPARRRRRG